MRGVTNDVNSAPDLAERSVRLRPAIVCSKQFLHIADKRSYIRPPGSLLPVRQRSRTQIQNGNKAGHPSLEDGSLLQTATAG